MSKTTEAQRLREHDPIEERSVVEAAHLAWAARAELDQSRAIQSFRAKMFQRLKLKQSEYVVEPDRFPERFDPWDRIGAEIEGVTFCFNEGKALSVVGWKCTKCERHYRDSVADLMTLGRALAQAAEIQARKPTCKDIGQRCLA